MMTTTQPDLVDNKPMTLANIREASAILASRQDVLDLIDKIGGRVLKFSEMLKVVEFMGECAIRKSIYLLHTDILFHPKTILGDKSISVGKMVWEYLQGDDNPNTRDWVRFRTRRMRLKRPYVSIG